MKRLSYVVVLCLFLFTVCFQTVSFAAEVTDADAYSLAEGDSISANSISIWGNYIFASTIDNGLEIIDMEDNSVIAKWNLSSTSVIPGLGTFSSVQTVVTDEYIICANNLYVVVFPNEGKYSDTPPELIARITPNPSNATRTFNNLKRMFVRDGFLYLFDLSAKNQINLVDKKANNAVVWKMPLSALENIDYNFDSLKWVGLEQETEGGLTEVEFAVMGEYQYFWNTVKIEDKYAYCVTYNDENLLPKKTMFLNIIDLETLECESKEIMQNKASGLQTEFKAQGQVTMEDIRALELYVARVDETQYVPLSKFLDVENTEYLMVDIDYNEEDDTSNVKIMFSANVINALVDIYECDENQIVNNGIVFAVDYEGRQREFVYITNDACYDSGIIAIDEDRDLIFVMTGEESGDNFIIPVETGKEINVLSRRVVTPISGNNIAVDAICLNNELIALYKGIGSRAAVYDVSQPDKIPFNFSRTLTLKSGIYLSNSLSQVVYYGNKYYYADTMGKSIGVLNTDNSVVFSNIFSDAENGEMPVRVYGYNTETDTVSITLDDNDDVISVPVSNGVWSYTISMTENGEHTINVLGEGASFEYTVDAKLPVIVEDAYYNENDELCVNVTNNTDKYESRMQNNTLKVIAVVYDENGIPVIPVAQDVTVPYGETQEVVFGDIWGMDVEDYNGTVKVYVLDEALAPLTTVYTFENEELSSTNVPTVTGKVAQLNISEPSVDANNKEININGTILCDGTRPVTMVVSKDGYIYDVAQAECDNDGQFEFKYSYAYDDLNGEGVYDITINTMMGGEGNVIKTQATVMDSEVFDEKLGIISEMESGEELYNYLSKPENEKFARELGLNPEDENFAGLSKTDQIKVMDECLDIIKSGDRSTLAQTYKTMSEELKYVADKKKAVTQINKATKSSIFGVLESNKAIIDKAGIEKAYEDAFAAIYKEAYNEAYKAAKDAGKSDSEAKEAAKAAGNAAVSDPGASVKADAAVEKWKASWDELWKEYSDATNSDKISIGSYFVETDITDLGNVKGHLEGAIASFEESAGGSGGGGGGGGGGSGGGGGGSNKVDGGNNVVDGQYTFPSKDNELVPVDPSQVYNPDEASFNDLGSAVWAQDAILYLAEYGVVNGVSKTEFLPNENVTREQFVKMLVIAFGLEDKYAVSSLKDVKSGAWYYEYVAAAEKCGLAEGDGVNFGVGRIMTREEMATFAYRAATIARLYLPENGEAESFADSDSIASYAREGITVMQKAGIINGVDGNLFAPKAGCSRAMAAKVVYELLNI